MMKQVFLNATIETDKHWVTMLNDCGLPKGDCQYIGGVTRLPIEEVIKYIMEADVIIFCCSFVPTYATTELIEKMMKYFLDNDIKGKTIVSCMDFLDALNDGDFCFDNPHQYAYVFVNNNILELANANISQIWWNGEKYFYRPSEYKNKYE